MFSNEIADGATTCLLENLIDLANNGIEGQEAEVNLTVRFKALSELFMLQNNLRNHERMSRILEDEKMALAYLGRGAAGALEA